VASSEVLNRETKENLAEQDSDTKKCKALQIHKSTCFGELPHVVFDCLYRDPPVHYRHNPARLALHARRAHTSHSPKPNVDSDDINTLRPASFSGNSLLVNEKKDNSPVIHATLL